MGQKKKKTCSLCVLFLPTHNIWTLSKGIVHEIQLHRGKARHKCVKSVNRVERLQIFSFMKMASKYYSVVFYSNIIQIFKMPNQQKNVLEN